VTSEVKPKTPANIIKSVRRYQLKQRFGIDDKDYDLLLAIQGGKCAICRKPCGTGRRLAVDHCHKTGAVRGLLCHRCNVGIGYFKDDHAVMRRATEYLWKASPEGARAMSERTETAKRRKAQQVPPVFSQVYSDSEILEANLRRWKE